MDLLSRSVIAVVLLIIVLFAIYYLIAHYGVSSEITKEQAVSLVLSDIKNSNPSLVVNVTNVTPSQFAGSWHISFTIIANATSPCPNFYSVSFDYPRYRFVPTLENNYTNNCIIDGFSNNSNYILASYPAAITRVYSFVAAQNYINRFGFSNISTSATFYKNASILGKNYTNVWKILYTSPKASYSEDFYITQIGGHLIANYSVPNS
ncbi:MAG: hypothetical protein ACP5RT_01440 [Candidatus Micrarchaeia archaeon]